MAAIYFKKSLIFSGCAGGAVVKALTYKCVWGRINWYSDYIGEGGKKKVKSYKCRMTGTND